MALMTLTRLCLSHLQKITDEGGNSLASMTALKDLDLSYCNEITVEDFFNLIPLTGLTKLVISHREWERGGVMLNRRLVVTINHAIWLKQHI